MIGCGIMRIGTPTSEGFNVLSLRRRRLIFRGGMRCRQKNVSTKCARDSSVVSSMLLTLVNELEGTPDFATPDAVVAHQFRELFRAEQRASDDYDNYSSKDSCEGLWKALLVPQEPSEDSSSSYRYAGTIKSGKSLFQHCLERLSPSRQVLFCQALMEAMSPTATATATVTTEATPRAMILHQALSCRPMPSHKVVQLLATPETTAAKDGRGRTPLHRACLHNYLPVTIQVLLDRNADVLAVPDEDNMLPLHYALQMYELDHALIQRMVRLFPEALSWKGISSQRQRQHISIDHRNDVHNSFGNNGGGTAVTPLLSALTPLGCGRELPLGMSRLLKELLHQQPNSIRSVEHDSHTALHYLCCRRNPFDRQLVSSFIQAWPIALCLRGKPIQMRNDGVVEEEDDDEEDLGGHNSNNNDNDNDEGSSEGDAAHLLPYEAAPHWDYFAPETRELLRSETKQVCTALFEYVFHDATNTTSDTMLAHVRDLAAEATMAVGGTSPPFGGSLASSTDTAIRSTGCPWDLCLTILRDDVTQKMLRSDEQVGCIIEGLYKMNKVRQSSIDRLDSCHSSPSEQALEVLECVMDNLDCIYLHMREHFSVLIVSGASGAV